METIIEWIKDSNQNTYVKLVPVYDEYVHLQQRANYETTSTTFGVKNKQTKPKTIPVPIQRGTIPTIFYKNTFIGAILPLVDELCLMYNESTLVECEDEFRRTAIQHLTNGPINTYIGKMKSKKLIVYFENPNKMVKKIPVEPPYDVMKAFIEFMFDKQCKMYINEELTNEIKYNPEVITITIANGKFGLYCS